MPTVITTVTSILGAILPHLGDIESEFEAMIKDVSTGEGGIAKVEKVAADLGKLLGVATGVLSSVSPGTPPTGSTPAP